MSNMMTKEHSILSAPYFDGKNYAEWKERMRIFIQSIDFKLWLVIKNGTKIPTKLIDNIEVEKSEDEYNEEDMKNMELEAKARHILNCALLNADTSEIFPQNNNTAKEMWDRLHSQMSVDANSPPPSTQLSNPPTTSNADPFNSPDLHFLEETNPNEFVQYCVPLHKFALNDNWAEARLLINEYPLLKHAAIADGWSTLLHVAAGANHCNFVEQLLAILDDEHIILQDNKGNTAFCFAVASGNMKIVQLLLKRVPILPVIRGGGGHTPLHFAVMQGKCEMTWFLYEKTKDYLQPNDRKSLFFTSITTGNYHLALKLATEGTELVYACDDDGDTALQILAQNENTLHSCFHCPMVENPIMVNPGMEQHVIYQLVNFLWKTIVSEKDRREAIKIISTPYQLLFDAAEVGNFGFLSELISNHCDLIWQVDNKGRSIIHSAVLHRHANIFNLIHEIGSDKDIIVGYIVEGRNTLLHLAAKLAPPDRLQLVSGAAFQMCHELIWFEEVKKIMPPSYIKIKNSEDLIAQALFTEEHKELRKEGEEWMKRTAEYCMLISTFIATAVFASATNVPGGIDDQSKKPNYLDKTSFLVFAISDAIAFISSASATLIFLSILISRYAEYDFYKSLPLKLIFGLVSLFISITCMMIALGSLFFITYYYDSKVVPDSISVLAGLPMLLYIVLQYSLWTDILYSTFYCKNLFKPSIKMIYHL